MTDSKVALVTGCSSGLGQATALKLINEGYIVYATVRNKKDKNLLESKSALSKNLHVLILDLSKNESIQEAASFLLKNHRSIDSIIFNAATAVLGPPDSLKLEEVEYMFKVNVFSTIRLAQLLLPQMRNKKGGNLIFIGSTAGVESSGFFGVYSATKFAVEAIAASWATTLHKWNIKTTVIEPGSMNTNLPDTLSIGSYYSDSNPYKMFNINASKFLKQCLRAGTEPDVVADLILEILSTPSPFFRYQTCSYSKELVQRHLCDPSNEKWIKEHREFLENFYTEEKK